MILFFDACSSRGYMGLYSNGNNVVQEEYFHVAWNESTKISWLIHEFLHKNNVSYEQIENIVCVNGPGSFTGIRTITLVVNTLAYIYPNIFLTPISYFDLIDSYPLVKASSKRDLFVKYEKWDIIQIVSNDDFENLLQTDIIYWDVNHDRFTKQYKIYNDIDYKNICSSTKLQNLKKIAPLYIKKPNIS